jgi:hypothetical protein
MTIKEPAQQSSIHLGKGWGSTAIFIVTAALSFLFAGCKSIPEGTLTPRPGMGYLDFYAEEETGTLSWDIQQFDAEGKRYKILLSEVKPAPSKVVRVQLPPGDHLVRVAFLNQPIKLPATLNVSVREGQVTPVKVALTEGRTGTFQQREQTYGPTARGHYGRITKTRTVKGHAFDVKAEAAAPVDYAPRDQMPYAQAQQP